jgi:phenylacetate-coenzyme A ligase PaaK-like adenylate-forming protein
VEPGKLGEMVITVLFNRCQHLILCQLHDVAVYSDEECDCGLPSPCARLSWQG